MHQILITGVTDVQIAGKIETDFTKLRDTGKLRAVVPQADGNGVTRGEAHYEFIYDLLAIVEGRNLRFFARYPAGKRGSALATGQVSIASTFRPGTG